MTTLSEGEILWRQNAIKRFLLVRSICSPCLSLRELEKQVNTDLELLVNIVDGQMTVCELVDRYLKTKTGVRQSTKQGYVTVQRLLAKETFGKKTIRSVKTSDAKLFLIKL